MKKITIIAIVSLIVFGQAVWAQQSEIDGLTYNSQGYYEIPDAAALNALATYVNADAENTCAGLTFKVTKNITFSQSESEAFVPIGNGDEYNDILFAGTFDGQGHTISGINYSKSEGENIGLFGYISGALIQNVKMSNCSFTGNNAVGAIAGLASGAHDDFTHGIYNCTVGSNVTVTAVSATIESVEWPGTFVGGICGDCANTTLSGCTSAATVTGDEYVGGIAGRLMSSVKDGKERGIIEDCFFTGSVVTETTNKGSIVGARGAVIELEEGTIGLFKLTLLNDDSNATVKNATRIANYNDQIANVTLDSHTLYKDGAWNTLCLPFSLTNFTGTPLEGATVKALISTEFNNETGALTLNFTEDANNLTTIEAGKPYIVKWTGTDVSNPVFSSVTINNTQNTNMSTTSVDFVGSFSPAELAANDHTVLYLGGSNKLYYPSTKRTVGSCRAYFKLNGLSVGNPSSSNNADVRTFSINFGDGETTGVVSMKNGKRIMDKEAGAWYDLQGRKLSNRQMAKGIYINNGKKVVIK